jgi:hypothetical protein
MANQYFRRWNRFRNQSPRLPPLADEFEIEGSRPATKWLQTHVLVASLFVRVLPASSLHSALRLPCHHGWALLFRLAHRFFPSSGLGHGGQ